MEIKENYSKLPASGLDQDEILKMQEIFSRHENIDKVILYGSRAMGNWKPYSDIDLTVIGKGVTLEQIHEMPMRKCFSHRGMIIRGIPSGH